MAVLVFVDSLEGKITKSSYESASYGAKVAADMGTDAVAIAYGDVAEDNLAALGNYGIKKVMHHAAINEMDPMKLARLVQSAIEASGAEVVVFNQDYTGKSIAPIVSAKIKAGLVSGVVDYPNVSEGFKVKKNAFSGKAFATVEVKTAIKMVSIVTNSVGTEKGEGTASVEAFDADLGDSRISIQSIEMDAAEGEIALPEAELVVSAGRGMKGPDNWGMIEELAKELGAATACSRPVSDIGWRPHHEHVGQTGIAIRPNLYIAVGISGAIQHLAGVNGSKVIVVINTDEEAPFFKAADYGIVGDAFEVVPKLIDAIRKYKAAS